MTILCCISVSVLYSPNSNWFLVSRIERDCFILCCNSLISKHFFPFLFYFPWFFSFKMSNENTAMRCYAQTVLTTFWQKWRLHTFPDLKMMHSSKHRVIEYAFSNWCVSRVVCLFVCLFYFCIFLFYNLFVVFSCICYLFWLFTSVYFWRSVFFFTLFLIPVCNQIWWVYWYTSENPCFFLLLLKSLL